MSLASTAVAAFRERFGASPEYAAAAPGRVNLIGEHTDYTGGFVLPIAIDRCTVVVGSTTTADHSTLVAADLGCELAVDVTAPFEPIAPSAPHAFANYVLGVVRELAMQDLPCPNVNLLAISDIPIGAGLSSSAAVEVASCMVFEQVLGVECAPRERATLCRRAENTFVGTPCGIMDMYASIMAERGNALLIDCARTESQLIPLPARTEAMWLVFDTGVKHSLADSAYGDRRGSCDDAARILGVASLRDATVGMIESAHATGAMDDTLRNRAMHVVLENVRTLLAANALATGDLPAFCAQMFESHKSLRNLYDVSCDELDCVVDAVHRLRDESPTESLGARMTGGGFGGSALVCCRPALADAVQTVVAAAFEQAFGRSVRCFEVHPSDGARRLHLDG